MASQEPVQERPVDERDDYHLLEIANWEDMNVLPSCKNYQVEGLDAERPLLSVDNLYFEGHHQEVFGTNMYFYLEDGRAKFFGSGTRKTVFHRVVPHPKEESAAAEVLRNKRRSGMQNLNLNLDAMADTDLTAVMSKNQKR